VSLRPPDYHLWPREKQNAWFAAEAAEYRAKQNGRSNKYEPVFWTAEENDPSVSFVSDQGSMFRGPSPNLCRTA
jgi:hypothetical protein